MERRAARVVVGLVVAAVLGLGPATAGAFPRWPHGVVTYHIAAPSLAWPVHQAAAAWNRSGAHVRFIEQPASRAVLVVRPMPRGDCLGAVGLAPVGAGPPGWRGTVVLQTGCSRFDLVAIAAHELGHTLGLLHDDRHCSVMNSAVRASCTDRLLPWQYLCNPLAAIDVRRAVRLYGGTVRRPSREPCLSAPTPTAASAVCLEPNPGGSFAATRITWRNPASRSLRRVLVNRRRGKQCPTYPTLPTVALVPGTAPLQGELVGVVDAKASRGGAQELLDTAQLAPGTWCYAVWALGPDGRYTRAGTARIVHPGTDLSPARIGLAATIAPAAGVRVRLSWTTPSVPGLTSVVVQRQAGLCPTDGLGFYGSTVGNASTTAGPASVDDPDAVSDGGTWCYAVAFGADGSAASQTTFLLEVPNVPGPPNVPPQAAFQAFPTEGSITDGTNELSFSDESYDADGTVVAWDWDFGDGSTGAGASVLHLYTTPGSYGVTLRVTDDRGGTATIAATVVITP